MEVRFRFVHNRDAIGQRTSLGVEDAAELEQDLLTGG
jgi:hypothetical protein